MKVVMLSGAYTPKNYSSDADKFMKLEINIMLARQVAKYLWGKGIPVICPQSNSGNFDCVADPEVFYNGYLAILETVDCVVMLTNWEESKGAIMEKKHAEELGIPVYFCEEDGQAYKIVDKYGNDVEVLNK